ncbi:MAG: trehalase [Myxococcales bacterium]|nr:trehalase [Myxococcales bacterium]
MRAPLPIVALVATLLSVPACAEPLAPPHVPRVEVDVAETLQRLIADEDTDDDKKITVEDGGSAGRARGNGRFWLISSDDESRRYEVVGTYPLSNLLQELKLAQDAGRDVTVIDPNRIYESPERRISRLIRQVYWDGLTRRIDGESLAVSVADEKIATEGARYLYVPHQDQPAWDYFSKVAKDRPELELIVERLPRRVTASYVRDALAGKHGLLTLALECKSKYECTGVPFVVPGGRFNEMYGWDSYFEALGLLQDGRVDLAKAMVDNFVYQITHYGKILNANRTYYLTRSQPPFLTSMAMAVYGSLPVASRSKEWLAAVLWAAIQEHDQVWMDKDHRPEQAGGLSRYYGMGKGQPPEVEPGHFDAVYERYLVDRSRLANLARVLRIRWWIQRSVRQLEEQYKAGRIDAPVLNRHFVHDRCVRESGHDTTYRWDWDGDRCADFATVDLNSLLYKIELDIGRILDDHFNGRLIRADGREESAKRWRNLAAQRKKLIRDYLWDAERGMFFDYDFGKNHARHTQYVSATTFYPLWAWHPDDPNTALLTREEARRLIATALPELEMPGGVAASAARSRGPLTKSRPARQWDYPNGWAPHQMLIWQGLLNYGFKEIAQRLIYRWLYTITRNAVDYNGTIPEKLDVVTRSHRVFAEYGNVGTEFAYITKEGFGWMNASYQVGLALLSPALRHQLAQLVPPERIFP